MPLPKKVKPKAYLYPDGPSFNCPNCGLHIHGSESRIWFPLELYKTACEECGREICVQEEIEVIKK
jgi:transcription elongation factor Elf1